MKTVAIFCALMTIASCTSIKSVLHPTSTVTAYSFEGSLTPAAFKYMFQSPFLNSQGYFGYNLYPTPLYQNVFSHPSGSYYPGSQYPSNQYPVSNYPVSNYPSSQYPVSNYPVSNYPGFTNPIYGGQVPIFGGQNPIFGGQNPAFGGQNPIFGYPGIPAQTPVQTPVQVPAGISPSQPSGPGVSVGEDSVSVEAAI